MTPDVGDAVPALRARSLTRVVETPDGRRLPLMDRLDLRVEPGESVAVLGRSGSGKSTLLGVVGLLAPFDSGSLEIAGVDVSGLADRALSRLRNRSIGFVFQNYSLVGHLSAGENVELVLLQAGPPGRRGRAAAVSAALESVGLGGRERSMPRELSGGEQQRVAIARALVRSPSLILADEPTGALDTGTAELVLSLLTTATRSRGAALVLVTHDPGVAAGLDRRVGLRDGRLHETEGIPDAVPA